MTFKTSTNTHTTTSLSFCPKERNEKGKEINCKEEEAKSSNLNSLMSDY